MNEHQILHNTHQKQSFQLATSKLHSSLQTMNETLTRKILITLCFSFEAIYQSNTRSNQNQFVMENVERTLKGFCRVFQGIGRREMFWAFGAIRRLQREQLDREVKEKTLNYLRRSYSVSILGIVECSSPKMAKNKSLKQQNKTEENQLDVQLRAMKQKIEKLQTLYRSILIIKKK